MTDGSTSEFLAPPAGWFPDPNDGRTRWWDGHSWGVYAPEPEASTTADTEPDSDNGDNEV